MKDKLYGLLSLLTVVTFAASLLFLSVWGVWMSGRLVKNTVTSSFTDKAPSESRWYLKQIAPPIDSIAKCRETRNAETGESSSLCRITTIDSDRLIRCTGDSTKRGPDGDPECHVVTDFRAAAAGQTSPPKTDDAPPSSPPATPDAGVSAPDAKKTK